MQLDGVQSDGFLRVWLVVAAAQVATYVLHCIVPGLVGMLALVPINTATGCLWNLITYVIYDTSIFMVALNVSALAMAGRALEPAFQSSPFAIFMIYVAVCVGVAVWITLVSWFMITRWEVFVVGAHYGFSPINAALAVALKQCSPDKNVFAQTALVKFKHLPSLLLCAALALTILEHSRKEFLPVVYGTYFGWLYLRFYRVDPDTGLVGDASEQFSFASFFPAPLVSYIEYPAGLMFKIARVCGFFHAYVKSNHLATAGLPSSPNQTPRTSIPLPVLDPAAERRRLMAIKAIDDKIAEARFQAGQNSPTNASRENPGERAIATRAHSAFDVVLM